MAPFFIDWKMPFKIVILLLILAVGLLAPQLGWFDWHLILEVGERYAHTWWFAPTIIVIKVGLYMFALPGSMMIWVAGLFYGPVVSTAIIVAGGLGGGLAAYVFSRRMSEDFAGKKADSRFCRFLAKHTDLMTLCAIRTLPNFPHSVINYGSGLLGVPLPRFLISTAIGFAVKGFLYGAMIRQAWTADGLTDMVNLKTLGPLLALVALFMVGKWLQKFIRSSEER